MLNTTRPAPIIAPRGVPGRTGPAPWTLPTPWQTATQYNAATVLAPASAVTYNRAVYACLNSHISGASFDPAQWVMVSDPGNALAAEAANTSALQAKNDAQAARDAAAASKTGTTADALATAADRIAVHADRVAADASAGSAATNAAALSAMLASFRSLFLGAFASDAAANAFATANAVTLSAGVMFENTGTGKFRIYSGNAWVDYDASAQALTAQASLSAASAAQSLGTVQSLYQQFFSSYLGAFASDAAASAAAATLGATLGNGTHYWSTAALKMRVYNAGAWGDYDATAQAAATTATNQATAASASATSASGQATAAAASASAAAISQSAIAAAIASVNGMATAPSGPYLLDGLPPAAIVSVPKLAYALSGAVSSLTSILSLSTAAKYTVDANGSYTRKAANSPAIDWSSGRARLLIETIAATNTVIQSEGDITTYVGGSQCTTAATSIGPFAKAIALAAGNNNIYAYKSLSVTAGTTYTFSAFVQMDDGSAPVFGGNSVTGDMCMLVNGVVTVPDSVALVGGTLYRASKTFTPATTATVYFGTLKYQAQTAKTMRVGGYQLEANSRASSYIPTTTAPVTRPADVVTLTAAARAMLTSNAATIALRGSALDVNTGCVLGGNGWSQVTINASTSGSQAWNSGQLAALNASPGAVNAPNFGIALASTPGRRRFALNGGAVATDTNAQFSGAETVFAIGANYDGSQPGDLMLDELVIWQQLGSTTGLQGQARVYS